MTKDLTARKGLYTPEYMSRPMEPVPAYIVGTLAIHRRPVPKGAKLRWTITHLPTKAHVEKALPASFLDRSGLVDVTAKVLMDWATAWQVSCPEFFELVDGLGAIGDRDWTGSVHRPMIAAAVATGRSLG